MENNMKTTWKKPSMLTVNDKSIKERIAVSACSNYDDGSDCFPAGYHLDSIPGNPPIKM